MDERTQKVALASCMFLCLLLFFLFLFWFTSSSPRRRTEQDRGNELVDLNDMQDILDSLPVSSSQKQDRQPSISRAQPTRRTVSTGRGSFSEKQIEEIQKRTQQHRQKLEKVAEQWVMDRVNDQSLPENVRERYKLRTIQPYVNGLELYKNGDYYDSVRSLFEVLDHPDATPLAKYMALVYMRSAATKARDFGLFIELSMIQAQLIATEDLTSIGIEKDERSIRWCNIQKELFEARKNSAAFDGIVAKRLRERNLTSRSRSNEERILKNEIKDFEQRFKEFFGHET